jgi:hypothetical protein
MYCTYVMLTRDAAAAEVSLEMDSGGSVHPGVATGMEECMIEVHDKMARLDYVRVREKGRRASLFATFQDIYIIKTLFYSTIQHDQNTGQSTACACTPQRRAAAELG